MRSGESTADASPAWHGALLLALSLTWALVLARFGDGEIYGVMGGHALVVCVVVGWLRGAALRGVLRPRGGLVALGGLVGLTMIVGTYASFELVRRLLPEVAGYVSRLYRAAGADVPLVALAWTLVILTAEELLWRDAWVAVWTPRWGRARAAATSVLAFATAQVGSGSLIVVLLAVTCGAIWTALRVRTGSLVPSLVAHALWTPTVILLHPVV